MKFHKQKYLSIREGEKKIQIGSCYPTAIECLLDLEVDQVPNFQLLYFQRDGQQERLDKYLKEHYLAGKHFDNAEDYQRENYLHKKNLCCGIWDLSLRYWLASEGYEMRFYDLDWYKNNPDKPYMVSGMSPRGFQHVCIYKNGELFHDPHPDGTGLVRHGVNIEVIEKLEYI